MLPPDDFPLAWQSSAEALRCACAHTCTHRFSCSSTTRRRQAARAFHSFSTLDLLMCCLSRSSPGAHKAVCDESFIGSQLQRGCVGDQKSAACWRTVTYRIKGNAIIAEGFSSDRSCNLPAILPVIRIRWVVSVCFRLFNFVLFCFVSNRCSYFKIPKSNGNLFAIKYE